MNVHKLMMIYYVVSMEAREGPAGERKGVSPACLSGY